jgi:adenylate cyclase
LSAYDRSRFGATVRGDFSNRRRLGVVEEKSLRASASTALESRSLGHPDFEYLEVGERGTAPMVAVFLDLTNFTARTFWDDQEEAVDLAHAVLTGFIEVVGRFGGHPLGLRGDGLFAGFSPGSPAFTGAMALSACAFALDGVENEVNPWLDHHGMARVQARAGLDFGPINFVRTGSHGSSEINPLGFAANSAAKCEKIAASWEIVAGEGLVNQMPEPSHFVQHDASPKRYTRNNQVRRYRFYNYQWRSTLPHLPGVMEALDGTPTSAIYPG